MGHANLAIPHGVAKPAKVVPSAPKITKFLHVTPKQAEFIRRGNEFHINLLRKNCGVNISFHLTRDPRGRPSVRLDGTVEQVSVATKWIERQCQRHKRAHLEACIKRKRAPYTNFAGGAFSPIPGWHCQIDDNKSGPTQRLFEVFQAGLSLIAHHRGRIIYDMCQRSGVRVELMCNKEGTAQSRFYILKVTGTVYQIQVATSCLNIESRKYLGMMAASRDIFPSSAMPSSKRTKHNDCYLGESSRTTGTDTQDHAKS